MADARMLARVFRALSTPTRVRIVEILKGRALCVNALAGRLKVTPAAVSQHLRILRDADLVMAEKRGHFVHYRVNEKTLAAWRRLADGLLSAGSEQRSLPAGGARASPQSPMRTGRTRAARRSEVSHGGMAWR